VLNENGSLDPVPDNVQMSQSVTFQTVEGRSGRVDTPLLLSNAPDYLMLSLEGLNALFEVRPVYYWSKGNRYLVPDRALRQQGCLRGEADQGDPRPVCWPPVDCF
jgi:hypothetical protein